MNSPRTLKIGDQLTLNYRLTCNDAEIVNTFGAEPATLRFGQGEIDVRLESLLTGLRVGDRRTYDLPPGAAFGDHEAGMVHELPREEFTADLALIPGHDMEFSLPNGQTLHGIIRRVENDCVEIDFNHPLAGLPVQFEIEILAIEPNTQAD